MEKRLVGSGLLAGAIAGTLAFLLARVMAEPVIGRAIEYEDGRADVASAHGVHDHGVELFTRAVQANAGLGFGMLIFGVAMGSLFAVLFSVTYGRVGSIGPQAFSILLSIGVFVALYLVPFLKYPANPPAVGHTDTIGARTGWYLVMVLSSVLLAAGAAWLARKLVSRIGAWNAGLTAVAVYVLAIALVMLVLPNVDEAPEPMRDASGVIVYPGFPADVLYDFRLASVGIQLVLWMTIGLVFSMFAGRLLVERAEGGRAASITA
ncbi:CbtA family protein [Mycobacterium xenopi]|uniref:Cobalt transporter n=1 Tax=Mycobacterium xenopi TaxID=1789 RepID=A0AAD1LZA2_MYCXE|nr:CbtA family protein [Mycobacterium xenopi]MDA3641263.1 CbtA family protein [Mycobacterium xenopi]MDA3659253.1 CbtA family protein [Mycobacterium xenopi]MDA3663474.1 CbtA family protein [Mycobacterium xenopi]ORX18930.1 cobalt transporter [Mycobacterium xenopi]SPX79402.1 putative cobalt transporter subunit (CbtA) family protein [Mycobacterium xenopi]